MKKKCVFAVVTVALLLGAVFEANADIRLDFDIPILMAAGVSIADATGNTADNTIDLSNLHIPLPYLELAYQWGDGSIRGDGSLGGMTRWH